MMPNEGGLSMYRGLKTDENLKRIPVVMLSGVEKGTFLHSLKMLHTGGQTALPEPEGYLEKPPKAEELLGMVNALLGRGDSI
jgi:CheY-like chemotaxis protein